MVDLDERSIRDATFPWVAARVWRDCCVVLPVFRPTRWPWSVHRFVILRCWAGRRHLFCRYRFVVLRSRRGHDGGGQNGSGPAVA